jgi:FkbM family methyltransferase
VKRAAAAIERARRLYLENAPRALVEATARVLARGRPLAVEPGWRFDVGADDPRQLTQFRRDLWTYYRERKIQSPVLFHWYEGLRVRLFLGNDLSLCLYAGGSFEPNEFAFLHSALRPGMIFVDGGANDGLYSLFAARHVRPNGLVIAVEPSQREYDRLIANLRLNRIANVKATKIALGRESGVAALAIAEDGHEGQNTIGATVSNPTVETAWHETVPVETIDELVAAEELERVDFIKLDVEGSEVDALEGARATIARFRPLMLLEAEDERLASQQRTKDDFVQLVTGFGYELWIFDSATGQLRPARRPQEPEGNTVAAPQGWRPPMLG